MSGTFACDEYGRPFIILRDQENQRRLTGNDAIKVRLALKKKYFLLLKQFNHKITFKIFKIKKNPRLSHIDCHY